VEPDRIEPTMKIGASCMRAIMDAGGSLPGGVGPGLRRQGDVLMAGSHP
jgi:hypothetical protein